MNTVNPVSRCIKYSANRIVLCLLAGFVFLPDALAGPLHDAVKDGDAPAVAALINKGENVNAPDDKGLLPLQIAADQRSLAIAVLLVEHGASLTEKSKDDVGETPLHIAALTGFTDLFDLAKKKGANIDVPNNDGATPLHYAAWAKSVRSVSVLIALGASITATNKYGASAAIYASKEPIVQVMGSADEATVEMIKILKQHGGKINLPDNEGATPLHNCAGNGYYKCVVYLIENGVNANAATTSNLTPLMVAAATGRTPIVEYLLKHGAHPNIKSSNGKSAMDYATAKGQDAVVRILMKAAK
jgi:ankyrin repeat protein